MELILKKAKRIALATTLVFTGVLAALLFGFTFHQIPEKELVMELIEDPEPDFFEKLEKKKFEKFNIETNKASNEAGKISEYEPPEPLASLSELQANKDLSGLAAEMARSAGGGAISQLIDSRLEQMRENAPPKGQPIKLAKRTAVSYNLKGRIHRELPIPVYKCLEGGEVVINIAVDGRGRILDAWFNEPMSSTTNGCLIENAIQYAKLSRFQDSGKDYQEGTITYLFPPKDK